MLQILFVCSSSLFCERKFLALSKHWTRKEYYLRWKRFYVSHIIRWRCRLHFRNVTNNILRTLQVYFAQSIGHWFMFKFMSISCRIRQLKRAFSSKWVKNAFVYSVAIKLFVRSCPDISYRKFQFKTITSSEISQ